MTREEAIKWVDDRMCWGRGTFTENHPPNIDECWKAGRMAIKALSAERTGEWIYGNGNGECSVCGKEKSIGWDNYCSYCGAKMGGDTE